MSVKLTKDQQRLLEEKIFFAHEEVSIYELMDKTKELLIEQSVARESEVAYFYFFFTFFCVLTGFAIMWFLATKFSSFGEYFNEFFCRTKKY